MTHSPFRLRKQNKDFQTLSIARRVRWYIVFVDFKASFNLCEDFPVARMLSQIIFKFCFVQCTYLCELCRFLLRWSHMLSSMLLSDANKTKETRYICLHPLWGIFVYEILIEHRTITTFLIEHALISRINSISLLEEKIGSFSSYAASMAYFKSYIWRLLISFSTVVLYIGIMEVRDFSP